MRFDFFEVVDNSKNEPGGMCCLGETKVFHATTTTHRTLLGIPLPIGDPSNIKKINISGDFLF